MEVKEEQSDLSVQPITDPVITQRLNYLSHLSHDDWIDTLTSYLAAGKATGDAGGTCTGYGAGTAATAEIVLAATQRLENSASRDSKLRLYHDEP